MDFSKKLYLLLSKNKLTQEKFAERMKTKRQVVGRWLNGTKPSAISIAKIAEALNVTPEYLLCDEENKQLSEMDLLKKENELLKKENSLLKKELKNKKK